MKRIGVFIDIQNIYMTTKTRFQQGKINFRVLRDYFSRDHAITTFTAFTCFDPDNNRQRDFFNLLGLIGYRVVAKPIKRLPDGTAKASMDMEMAVEILTQAPRLDEIVLITGDGDFVALVNHLCAMGKVVTVVGPDQLTAPELIQACHEFINLHQIEGILDLEGRGGDRRALDQAALLSTDELPAEVDVP
ncbi:MAG: NYN domain-containing protein [candidate division KSB1 bacterium]|nr:NYN domain-containing protein [candidate division KSB1 bacterium]MDZ7293810.1 NYN domain-containing protein [candidate division KSB1 bacterium]MDZ7338801.1 NYN domain-containing protein [candidate division KSB1 bacterium]MDZ7378109.1 NYN domain-containing protein [candidate division KSB1 bacterium]MDZ7386753.1 NYN domain-containing protein [candidate division KSB1 bacterium]